MYTYAELDAQTRVQLLALIDWNGLGIISKYAKKGEIVDFILKATHEDVVEEEPPMSVRIRRIRKASK